ncbi:MAG: benzoyl-CoA reductase subunit C [Deltaproteobacteria bacterium]|nr:benzoyl-CoA reductase subunit C [Deltaproteobacteria bacterium]
MTPPHDIAPGLGPIGRAADPCAVYVGRARALFDDKALDHVRAWKTAHPGALAVGHMPIYTPRPLLEALGCLPVAVFGGGEEVDIIRGDSYFQSYICHIPRSTIELALAGTYDCLDGMIFPSICDVIRNLSGMWKMLFPDRYAAYLDLPQNFSAGIGGRFYEHELRRIAAELTARGALPLGDARMRQALRDENRRRRAIARLDALRRAEPWRCPASEAYLLVRAGAGLLATDHAELLESFLDAAPRRAGRPLDNVRVVLSGSFCEQPPLDLIVALEKAGCDIVDDDFQLGLRTIEGDTDDTAADPLKALAHAFLDQGRATASRYIDKDEKGRALIDQVRAAGADGVVFAAASFCDPALLDQPMLETALAKAGVPFTSFKFAENNGQFQTIREQAGAFSDSVKLWGAAH